MGNRNCQIKIGTTYIDLYPRSLGSLVGKFWIKSGVNPYSQHPVSYTLQAPCFNVTSHTIIISVIMPWANDIEYDVKLWSSPPQYGINSFRWQLTSTQAGDSSNLAKIWQSRAKLLQTQLTSQFNDTCIVNHTQTGYDKMHTFWNINPTCLEWSKL